MATTINLSLQSQVQESNRHVVQQTRSLLTTFSKLPWKASKLKHPSECYQYSARQSNNVLLPLTAAHQKPHSQSITGVIASTEKMSLISQPAQLQPRPPVRRHTTAVPRHKFVSFSEPFLYPDPLGDARTDLCEFYHRVAELSRLEEETVKWEELQNKAHCKPSYSTSRLSRRPSSEKQLSMVRGPVKTDETSHSIPALVVTQSSKLESPTHYVSNPDLPSEDHSGDCEVPATVSSPTHSESNSSEPTISSAPVILTNGKLSSSDCQQARHHLRRSMSQDHVSPRKTTKSRHRLPQRSGSATLLTESSSSTSVSSTCSERYHNKHHRVNSNKKKHKK